MRKKSRNVKQLATPISDETVRGLHIGDQVEISGIMYTARDAAHKYLVEERPAEFRERLGGGVIYHCGPVVRKLKRKEGWKIVAAGPTTSIREEPYEAQVIEDYGVRAVIGKGGMGDKTLQACRKHGCVYLASVGGAATLLANTVVRVQGVYKLDFGIPEAFWELEVKNFPAIVTMDSHGESLYRVVAESSETKFRKIVGL
jgi:fumarate hydratase class I